MNPKNNLYILIVNFIVSILIASISGYFAYISSTKSAQATEQAALINERATQLSINSQENMAKFKIEQDKINDLIHRKESLLQQFIKITSKSQEYHDIVITFTNLQKDDIDGAKYLFSQEHSKNIYEYIADYKNSLINISLLFNECKTYSNYLLNPIRSSQPWNNSTYDTDQLIECMNDHKN